jgi:mannose-6-phosphate isomerase
MAPSLGWRGDAAGLIRHALDYFVARYQRPDGLFRTLIAADGSPLDNSALLYDQAFALLAFNVAAAGGESRAARAAVIRASRAGHEAHEACGAGFNPACRRACRCSRIRHMHLFEAALAGCEVCSDSSVWKPLSDEIAELALNKFVDAETGALREFFDEQWNPAPGIPGRIVEPGHQFEWAWLLLRWGGTKNARARAVALRLIEIGEMHGVRHGLATNSLLDDFSAHDAGARLWPQTERLKAAAIAARLTGEAKYFSMTVAAADRLMRYLDCPIPGLWYDRIDAQGDIVDEPAPAAASTTS